MKEYIEQTVTNADGTQKVEKIKTPLAQIIVEQYHGKEYYDILWLDTKSWDFHIGYGSYNLEFVRKWLAEEFEIVEAAADVVERKRGEWVIKNGRIVCDQCEEILAVCPNRDQLNDILLELKEIEKFCYNCGADMRSHHDSLCDQEEER